MPWGWGEPFGHPTPILTEGPDIRPIPHHSLDQGEGIPAGMAAVALPPLEIVPQPDGASGIPLPSPLRSAVRAWGEGGGSAPLVLKAKGDGDVGHGGECRAVDPSAWHHFRPPCSRAHRMKAASSMRTRRPMRTITPYSSSPFVSAWKIRCRQDASVGGYR